MPPLLANYTSRKNIGNEKKWSRNGKVIKQGIGIKVYDVLAICNTCAMVIYQAYDTLISRGVWPHRGPCLILLRFIIHNETCFFWALGFHVYIANNNI